MRLRNLTLLLSLGLFWAQFGFAMSLDVAIKKLSPDEEACYYWNALHNADALQVPEAELWAYFDDKFLEIVHGEVATRDIETALLIARENGSAGAEVSASQLQKWNKIILSSEALSDQLVKEITTTLVMFESVESSTVQQLLFSDDIRVREAAFSAASIYGDEKFRDKLFKQFKDREQNEQRQIRDAFEVIQLEYEKGQKLLEKAKNERLSNHSAYKDMKDYMYYKSEGVAQEISASELMSFMGRSRVHEIASTAHDFYEGGGAYLWPSLTNLYWLGRLSKTLESAENKEERIRLENAYREGFRESEPGNLKYAVRLYYLLGFDLSEKEEAFLLNDTKLPSEKMLPSGRIHLLKSYYPIRNKEVSNAEPPSTPSAPEVEEAAQEPSAAKQPAEVATTEPSEEPAEQSSNWWLWLIGLLVVVGGLAVVLRRKS